MFPKQAIYIIGTEACERFSYYGMKSILAGYMTGMLLMKEQTTTELVHFFMAFNYITPLLGGWIADRFWGRYSTILWISLMYCLGHAALACADLAHVEGFMSFLQSDGMQGIFASLRGELISESASDDVAWKTVCLLIGLTLIAVGSGGIKPCVSSFMGDQFADQPETKIRKAYAAFYWAINLGSFFSFLVIPAIKDSYGYSWAFAIPGILMAVATFIFWLGRKSYLRVPPVGKKTSSDQGGFFQVVSYCALNWRPRNGGFFAPAEKRFNEESISASRSVLRVFSLFLLVPPFWALFDQTGTTWVLQGKKMQDLVLSLPGDFSFKITAETVQSANPLLVMTLIPLLTIFVYPRLVRWTTPLRRMGTGIFLASISFVIVAWLQMRMESGEELCIVWQFFPYLVLTIGEVLLSTTGLEFAFTQAPKSMKSTIMSFWVLTVALGNLLVPIVNRMTQVFVSSDSPITSTQFLVYAGLVAIVAGFFALVAKSYKYREVRQ